MTPRILVIKMSAIGDVLHASPVAQALREAHPAAELGWLVHTHCQAMIVGNPYLTRVHRLDRKKFLSRLFQLRREILPHRYEAALDLQGLLKSALVARISGIRRRIGPADAREQAARVLYSELAPPQPGVHILDVYLNRAATLGATSRPSMYVPQSPADEAHIERLWTELQLDPHRPVVVLNPSAGKPNKLWGNENFSELGRKLEAQILVTGAPADRPMTAAIAEATGGHDLAGKTSLTQLAALLKRVDLFIGGDTGPMHIACAVGTPVCALFGPTDPAILGPIGDQHRTVYRPPSMEKISVEDVAETVRSQLAYPIR